MKVMTSQPVDFETGQVLTEEDMNDVVNYARDAIVDVAERRFTKSALLLQFVEDVGTPYTQAMNVEELTYRFRCPNTCIIERGFLSANMTSNAAVTVVIETTAGATPTNCTNPYLTTGAAVASASTDTTDFNPERFVLAANTEYLIKVVSSGSFTLNRFDVILHVTTDRWTPSGTSQLPVPDPGLVLSYNTPILAAQATAPQSDLVAAAARFASFKAAPAPALFVKHGLLSTTDADIRTFNIPRFQSTRAQCQCVRVYVWAYMAGVGGTTVTATLYNAPNGGGSAVATASANVAGVTQAGGDSGALTQSMVSAAAGVITTAASDYSLVLANASAATNAIKVYALVWFGR
jgi:hypothetical protein